MENLGPDSPDNADDPLSSDLEFGEGATLEQLRRLRQLTDEGMSERMAREEVLGKEWVQP
ncbi:MAG: hypothetical protein M3Q62_13290 [Actinomycetota bacterium]|nr:hypothetical protein [Rubrobacteraceae bacterium]MDQ3184477.1 hypothetical protein [Actinomycetota bacterium]